MTSLSLHGEYGKKLTIVVKGFEREFADNPYDANWLRCSADVDLGGFRGSLDASFTTSDFANLLKEMERLISGECTIATFNTMEEVLAFSIKVDRAGRATVSGKLKDVFQGRAELSFSFESDLTFLVKTRSDLEKVVARFPQRSSDI